VSSNYQFAFPFNVSFKRNETKSNKTKRNRTKRNETDRNETKRNITSFRFVSLDFVSFRFDRFRFVSFRFVSFRSVSFRFYFVSHFTGTLHIVTFCPTYIRYMNQGIYIYIVTSCPTYIHVKQKYKLWPFVRQGKILFFCLPFMYCIYNISFIGRDVRKSNIDFIEISCTPMKNYYLHQWFLVIKSVNGQKVTGQNVTKLLGQKVTGQKSQSIFFTLADKRSQLIFLLNMYVGRTGSHNIYIYTLIPSSFVTFCPVTFCPFTDLITTNHWCR
jgi:hypothetical protein